MKKENLLISFSSGRTSAYMTWYILMNYAGQFGEIAIVMANTGKEREESLLFANRCEGLFGRKVVWVEAVVQHGVKKGTSFKEVNYDTAARHGEPFEEVIKKYGIPNSAFPHCTRELKTRPIHSYIKSLGWKKYKTAIGIRADEMDRINWDSYKKLNYWYPLADDGLTKKDVEKFWRNQEFDLQLKAYEGNCDFCWKKSITKLKRIAKEKPAILEWWREMEAKYSMLKPPNRSGLSIPPYHFGRGNTPVNGVLKKGVSDSQISLFEFGCQESCEPF